MIEILLMLNRDGRREATCCILGYVILMILGLGVCVAVLAMGLSMF